MLWGPINLLSDKYSQYQHSTSQRSYDTVSDGVYVSKTGMTLDEFCFACVRRKLFVHCPHSSGKPFVV